jgi:hypothetical protein
VRRYWNTSVGDMSKWVDLDQVVAITELEAYGNNGIIFEIEMMMRDEPIHVLSRCDKDLHAWNSLTEQEKDDTPEREKDRIWQPLFDAWTGKAQ